MDAGNELVDLFLCHNGADKDWVEKLAEHIESETFDGRHNGRPLRVFFDKWDIDVGQNLILRINEGLAKARYVAVIISPEFLSAPWPTLEWTHVVADDPTNRKGRLIPLFRCDYSEKLKTRAELPAPLKTLNWIDFRRAAEFKRSYQKLIRKIRDQPPTRGKRRRPLASLTSPGTVLPSMEQDTSAAPDAIPDVVLGNLLPVEESPLTIWHAPTDARKNDDVRAKVKDAPPFILREKRLYTFADLTLASQKLREVIDIRDIKSQAVGRWKDDPVRWRWHIELLNRCLSSHLFSLPITRDEKHRYFFRPLMEGGDREWKNGDDPSRFVAARKVSPDGSKTFWVHQGADLSFQDLGDHLFLRIYPCYVFTSDGRQLLTGKTVGPLSMKWGGKERNAAILRHIIFWARTLTKGETKAEIQTGAKTIVLSGIPALARTNFGVDFDHIGFTSLLAQVEDELSLAADAALSGGFVPDEMSGEEESDV